MKKTLLLLAAVAATALAPMAAYADRGHDRDHHRGWERHDNRHHGWNHRRDHRRNNYVVVRSSPNYYYYPSYYAAQPVYYDPTPSYNWFFSWR